MAYDVNSLMALKEEYADAAFNARLAHSEYRIVVLEFIEQLTLLAKRNKNLKLLAVIEKYADRLAAKPAEQPAKVGHKYYWEWHGYPVIITWKDKHTTTQWLANTPEQLLDIWKYIFSVMLTDGYYNQRDFENKDAEALFNKLASERGTLRDYYDWFINFRRDYEYEDITLSKPAGYKD